MRSSPLVMIWALSLLLSGALAEMPTALAQHMSIYLAGPLGFSEGGREFKDGLIRQLSELGYHVIDPFKLTDESKVKAIASLPRSEARREAWKKLDIEIAKGNQYAIDSCDGILAILDGTDVDSGTAAEIGYAFARHKRILGYRGDFRLSSDNEGTTVNLQVEYFIRASGGDIVFSRSNIPNALSQMFSSRN